MNDIGTRLRHIREDRALSLRDFAAVLRDRADYEISHSTVNKYENGQPPPAAYLLAVSRAFSVDASWLLEGDEKGDPPEAIRDVGEIRQRLQELLEHISPVASENPELAQGETDVGAEWERASREWDASLTSSPRVVRSHERSEAASVPREAARVEFRRVDGEELERRRERSRDLLETAAPHLRWLSGLLGSIPHVAYVVDEDGIVLDAQGDETLIDEWRVRPGYDWSEQQMGTNGAGTALGAGRPVAVLGREHSNEAFWNITCLGAPIRGPDGDIRGAIDVSTKMEHGLPGRLLPVVYAAWTISRELGGSSRHGSG